MIVSIWPTEFNYRVYVHLFEVFIVLELDDSLAQHAHLNMTIKPGILRRHQSIDVICHVESANGTYYAMCWANVMWGLRTLIIVALDDELVFEDFVIVFLMLCVNFVNLIVALIVYAVEKSIFELSLKVH